MNKKRAQFLKLLFSLGTILLTSLSASGIQANTETSSVPKSKQASPSSTAATSVAMERRKISSHVYYVKGKAGVATDNEGFISNSGFVVTEEGVVVFDALGTPSLSAKLITLIREVTDQPIRKVVMSHYHADHIYGLQNFEDMGAQIIAPKGSDKYLSSDEARARLEERQVSLWPWVNEDTRLVWPDKLVEESFSFVLGGVSFNLNYMGKAHSDGDLAMLVEPDKVLFSGDLIFEGRIPFVGNADTKNWLATLEKMETGGLAAMVPGHGGASLKPAETIGLTRKYLAYLRKTMGAAVEEFQPFAEVYDSTDWSEFEKLPAFEAGNRINAYQVYLSMEAELLAN
jgi:glyoxylase-like metal-dependent hydrolase (beta-lactamase superfamily II)